MNLIMYDKLACQEDKPAKRKKYTINVSNRGLFALNKAFTEDCNINSDSFFVLAQDFENKKDWYLIIWSHDLVQTNPMLQNPMSFTFNQAKCYAKFNSKKLAFKMKESLGIYPEHNVTFLIGIEPIVDLKPALAYPIITNSAQIK